MFSMFGPSVRSRLTECVILISLATPSGWSWATSRGQPKEAVPRGLEPSRLPEKWALLLLQWEARPLPTEQAALGWRPLAVWASS